MKNSKTDEERRAAEARARQLRAHFVDVTAGMLVAHQELIAAGYTEASMKLQNAIGLPAAQIIVPSLLPPE